MYYFISRYDHRSPVELGNRFTWVDLKHRGSSVFDIGCIVAPLFVWKVVLV